MKIDRKLKVPPTPADRILNQKGREVFKMTKITILSKKFAISGSFEENHKMGKSDLKLAEYS